MKQRIGQITLPSLLKLTALSLLFTACVNINSAPAQTIIYVKKGGTGNGTSWAQAYGDLQQAITTAVSTSGNKQIWVAKGEYFPTATSDRTISFILPAQTFIYGGFVGNESTLQARNWQLNRTILSGDLGRLFDITDNSYHVVVAKDVDQNSGLDGLVITQGNASIVDSEEYHNAGGGLLILANVNLTSPQINNCEFIKNNSVGIGGGVAVAGNGAEATPRIANSYFKGNKSARGGGAGNLNVENGVNIAIYVNCVFALNHATESGGAIVNFASNAKIINCSFSFNSTLINGGAIYNLASNSAEIRNSILWRNFKGTIPKGSAFNQIFNAYGSTAVVQDNIVQGGFGATSDNNKDIDPLFNRESIFNASIPRTSIIPVQTTDIKYENQLRFSGSPMPNRWTYATYMDQVNNKLYLTGRSLQVIDFANLTNGLPTSTIHSEVNWGRTQKIQESIHQSGNKIYFASTNSNGLVAIDRTTGTKTLTDPLVGTGLTYTQPKIQDVVIDNANNLLYAPVFYWPNDALYGLLELNLTNGTKRWITTSSTPVALAQTNPVADDNNYWGGHRIMLDAPSNTLYYSMGNGIWWWNRTTNATGVFNTQGGIPLMAGNPGLPSNLTTGMFIDHQQNKFYIGTHNGLFVWDRNNNTSKVYNTQNSLLVHNQINTIDKSEENNLIFVTGEQGGLFTINVVNGEQKIYTKDTGNEINPQMVHTNTSSAYFDDIGKVLYVSSDNGGVWVKDYGNKVQDFGDLRVKKGSPALDKGIASVYPSYITKDLDGLNRFSKYTASADTNRLDLGPYEKLYACPQPTLNFTVDKANGVHSFTPALAGLEEDCTFSYSWNLGDGTTTTESNPQHTYSYAGTFNASLTVKYKCGSCDSSQIVKTIPIELTTGLCGNIYCNDNGGVSIGTLIIPEGYKFAVKGHVIMEGGKILLHHRWPDYVFQPGYVLLPLLEVKRFIQENGHLPGVPSAQTVKAEGINVEEMSILMLKKTEELTLYLLQIEERLRKLETKKIKTP